MNTRMDRKKFHFGLYGFENGPTSCRTEKYVKAIAEMGTNYVLTCRTSRETLDFMHKYGLGAIEFLNPLPHWGGNGYGYVGRMPEKYPLEKYYIEPSKTFQDHPALWALEMADEPSAMDFPYMGNVVEAINNAYPNQFPFINLYPSHARVAENTEDMIKSDLGATSYAAYLDQYCQYIPTDYISYDFYLYGGPLEGRDYNRAGKLSRFLENLRLVADVCRKHGKDFWIIMLGNNWECQPDGYPPATFAPANYLRFQAYTAMAFGVKTISWWEHWIFSRDGEITEQYDRIREVQLEIHDFADEYMKYRNVYTHFVGFENYPDLTCVNQESVECLNNGTFFGVKSDNGAPLIIGDMVSDTDGSHALMISTADDPYDHDPRSYNITFSAGKRMVHAYGAGGMIPVTKLEDGSYSVPISSNQGILVVAR
ncbi:MAG: hypothetical protein IJ325_01775 [Clostridia bacterium]|nr:hypothetical protein [Clostridia bacterium]